MIGGRNSVSFFVLHSTTRDEPGVQIPEDRPLPGGVCRDFREHAPPFLLRGSTTRRKLTYRSKLCAQGRDQQPGEEKLELVGPREARRANRAVDVRARSPEPLLAHHLSLLRHLRVSMHELPVVLRARERPGAHAPLAAR